MNIPASTQPQFSPTSFASNPEPRCPLILLADTSGSMNGQPISELNAGLITLKNDLMGDALAVKRVEICIISYPPVKVEVDFQIAHQFVPPSLAAAGQTPMGEAILKAIDLVGIRKDLYKANGLQYFRPWIFLITDGAPTDDWREAARRVHEGEDAKAFAFFSVGVNNADMSVLGQISKREPRKLESLKFSELFLWLSASIKVVAASLPGDKVTLPTPTGWTEV